MANGGDSSPMATMRRAIRMRREAVARARNEQENQVVPPPPIEIPTANPTQQLIAPRRVNLTEANRSLIISFRSASLTPQETSTCLQSLFDLMTSSEEEGEAQFEMLISELDESDLRRMASLLTADSNFFLEIARTWNGSNRLQKLLGTSDDVDAFFFYAILHRFLHVMTDMWASNVAIQGMRVFSQEKKTAMCPYIVFNVIYLACDLCGYSALNQIITDLDHPFYKDQVLYAVALNALFLSYHACGMFVVQHVLGLHDMRCTSNVAISLQGHFVELSYTMYGRYTVEMLLEMEESRDMVLTDLLWLSEFSLMKLAMNVYGNFVVEKALRVTEERNMTSAHQFWGLVNKLMPFLNLLRGTPGHNVATFVDRILASSQTR